MRHLRFGSSEKKCVARVVDGVVDLLLRGKRYLRDLKFFTGLDVYAGVAQAESLRLVIALGSSGVATRGVVAHLSCSALAKP